jgi:hypothetical protein
MERDGQIDVINSDLRIECLEKEILELRGQVRELLKWELRLRQVYRWWFGSLTPGYSCYNEHTGCATCRRVGLVLFK